jgi:ribosomal-protein-alanine N-acetyltransferase
MKHPIKKQNPVLAPLPLSAMVISTFAMIGMGFFTLAYYKKKPDAPITQSTRYVCERCELPNVFNNSLENKPVFGIDNSSNFRPVILKIMNGRYRHIIETERLLLREVTLDDLPELHAYFQKIDNAASSTWNVHTSEQETRDEILKIIEKYREGKEAHWAICNKETGAVMGLGGLFGYIPTHHKATMGWGFDSKYWGNGYATELGRACVEYGMKYLHLNRIDSVVRVDNIASRKVLEKIGMSLSACFRQYWRVKGELLSHYQFVILKKDIQRQLKKSKV